MRDHHIPEMFLPIGGKEKSMGMGICLSISLEHLSKKFPDCEVRGFKGKVRRMTVLLKSMNDLLPNRGLS